MAKSVIFHGETIEKAIDAGLQQLGVDRSQVRIEVISEPKKSIFGLPTKSAAVKLTLLDDENKDPSASESPAPVDGLLWVENGKLQYSPPQAGGENPVLIFDDLVTVYYNDTQCKHRVELDQGFEPLRLELPEDQQPRKDLKIYVTSDQLQAYVRINKLDGCRYYLVDQPPTRLLELKLEKEIIPHQVSPPKRFWIWLEMQESPTGLI